jgi:hypothetical protein
MKMCSSTSSSPHIIHPAYWCISGGGFTRALPMIVSTITSQVLLPGHIKFQVTNCPPFFKVQKDMCKNLHKKKETPPQKKIMRKKISRKKLSRKETGIA